MIYEIYGRYLNLFSEITIRVNRILTIYDSIVDLIDRDRNLIKFENWIIKK